MWSIQDTPRLSEEQAKRWCHHLEAKTGIRLPVPQQTHVRAQVSIRMRELGIEDSNEYFEFVNKGIQGALEWNLLVDRLMVKETCFYRHKESMNAIRKYLLDSISNRDQQGSLEIWSLGCSTGEEAYSLAIIASDCFNYLGRAPYFGVTGIDISLSALQTARAGRYPSQRLNALERHERDRHFKPLDDGRYYQVSPSLRERVCFSQANLADMESFPPANLDIICCQNLLIYFRRWRRKEILNELVERLKPGGLLVIGLGEVVDWKHPEIIKLGDDRVQAYRRRFN